MSTRQVELLREAEILKNNLPHLYGLKFYTWAREFYESRNKTNLLCAGNQLSKSSTQIRKCIHWATEKSLWPELWPMRAAQGLIPSTFFYFYPSQQLGNIEFKEKWVKEWLPRGALKSDPKYGWHSTEGREGIESVVFNSGVTIYFRFYSQKVTNLQASSVYALFADEEMPEEFYDELKMRVSATNGYFHMVFTATLGLHLWFRAMEMQGKKEEFLPTASKWMVSAYDCLKYEDGGPTPWTSERIEERKRDCKSEAEVKKRINGRFIKDTNLKYPAFSSRNEIMNWSVEKDGKGWRIYSAVDHGNGGKDNHPAACLFLAVRPDFKQGVAFRGWRGDGEVTASIDVLDRYIMLRGSMEITMQVYDYKDKDFQILAERRGENFIGANKFHAPGEEILNSLFKYDMLSVCTDDPEMGKLTDELRSVPKNGFGDKRNFKDDIADCLRYAAMAVPWDLVTEGAGAPKPNENVLTEQEKRRAIDVPEYEEEDEITYWNSFYEY